MPAELGRTSAAAAPPAELAEIVVRLATAWSIAKGRHADRSLPVLCGKAAATR